MSIIEKLMAVFLVNRKTELLWVPFSIFYVVGKIWAGGYQKLVFQWGPVGELQPNQVHFFLKSCDDYVFSLGKGGGPKYPPMGQL